MADKNNKVNLNIDGTYYVDNECIACQLCIGEAENNFKMDPNDEYAYVYKQPVNDGEKANCKSAMENCPVNAIGNDG